MTETTAAREDWAELEAALGYNFSNHQLLARALTHASSGSIGENNERLEFFGDSILDFLVCEYLFQTCPDLAEGELTEVKAAIVRRSTLARAAQQFGLRPWLRLGRGIGQRAQLPVSIFGNVFEALVAAIYLDSDLETARRWCLAHLAEEIENARSRARQENHKSLLQHRTQELQLGIPEYGVVSESGPDHAKHFTVRVCIDGQEAGCASGGSKKEAEQRAAAAALEAWNAGAYAPPQKDAG